MGRRTFQRSEWVVVWSNRLLKMVWGAGRVGWLVGWFGLVWVGLGWSGLVWVDLGWFGLIWVGVGWLNEI